MLLCLCPGVLTCAYAYALVKTSLDELIYSVYFSFSPNVFSALQEALKAHDTEIIIQARILKDLARLLPSI